MRDAFKKAGIKGSNPRPQNPGHRRSGRGKEVGDDEQRFKENLKRAFGEKYTRFILDFQKEEYNDLVTKIKSYVATNARNITTSQLRNVFTKVLQAREPFNAHLLRPKLAYVAGRADKPAMKELVYLLDELIQAIQNERHLKNFKDFFEAIIAYHRFFNPREGRN